MTILSDTDSIVKVLKIGRSNRDEIPLHEVMRIKRCTAPEADGFLRQLASEGYVYAQFTERFVVNELVWTLTKKGRQLALKPRTKPIDREQVDLVLAEVERRAREINQDPTKLHRISLRQFGSTLDEHLQSYGDVDIAVEFMVRKLPQDELTAIKSALKKRAPENLNFIGQLLAAENVDKKETLATLRKGLRGLSLMGDDLDELVTDFKWLVDYDVDAEADLPVSSGVVRPNAPAPVEDIPSLPTETVMPPQRREIAPHTKFATFRVDAVDAEKDEAELWIPKMADSSDQHLPTATPDEEQAERNKKNRSKVAGYRNICPIWRETGTTLDRLRRAFDWCVDHKAWPANCDLFVRMSRDYRTSYICLGMYPGQLWVDIRSNGFSAEINPQTRKNMAINDLAGAYAMASVLADFYRDTGMGKLNGKLVRIALGPLLESDLEAVPDLAKLDRSGTMDWDNFPGLLGVDTSPEWS